ncbi:MAG TPA: methyltransferase domain-containing protein [Planctomycetaceae bacterium]|jgi:phosphatidylethanolamine/phosphatidyl-N-methylethanolamine N-methyltransferase|nr:methyltransferase domain-containing protein [Planctomycetaceae bacterium]
MLRDHREFFRQFRTQFQTTGAIAPSSRRLARAMTRHISSARGPARILEVGPGTGAVTRQIVTLLKADDRLDLVELNEAFAGRLEQRFQSEPSFKQVADRAEIHVCGIESFQSDRPYDYIVSGLPFNNFSPAFVGRVLDAFFNFLAPGGVLSFFEYMYVRPVRGLVSRGAERTRIKDLDRILNGRLQQHGFRRDWVFLNLPPAWVQHLRKDA